MPDVIYAIKVAELSFGGLKVLDVKIGKTRNIDSTLRQYRRSQREAGVLGLWSPNPLKTLSECEHGIHAVAEKYAYDRKGEKFIFLQGGYEEFSNNINLILKRVSGERAENGKRKNRKEGKIGYTGKKPLSVKFLDQSYPVKTWREVLNAVATRIHKDKEDFTPVFDIAGRNMKYFSRHGSDLRAPQKIGDTPYFFTGNISANQTMSIINKLLSKFGYDKSSFGIEYE